MKILSEILEGNARGFFYRGRPKKSKPGKNPKKSKKVAKVTSKTKGNAAKNVLSKVKPKK